MKPQSIQTGADPKITTTTFDRSKLVSQKPRPAPINVQTSPQVKPSAKKPQDEKSCDEAKKEPVVSEPPPNEPQNATEPRGSKPTKPQQEEEHVAPQKQHDARLDISHSPAEPPKEDQPLSGTPSKKVVTTPEVAITQAGDNQILRQHHAVQPSVAAPQPPSEPSLPATVPSQASPINKGSAVSPSYASISSNRPTPEYVQTHHNEAKGLPAPSSPNTNWAQTSGMSQLQKLQDMNSYLDGFLANNIAFSGNAGEHLGDPISYSPPGDQCVSASSVSGGTGYTPWSQQYNFQNDVNMTDEFAAPTMPTQAQVPQMAAPTQYLAPSSSPPAAKTQAPNFSTYSSVPLNPSLRAVWNPGYTLPYESSPPASGWNHSFKQSV